MGDFLRLLNCHPAGFYEESARRGYIAAALAPFSDSVTFEVIPRDNPMAEYPSDFDVVQLGAEHEFGSGGTDPESVALQALLRHPAVKSITPQRKVTRSIKAVDEESGEEREFDEEEGEVVPEDDPCGVDDGGGDCARITKGRRSLSFGGWWNSAGRHQSRRLLRAVPRQVTAMLQADILWEMGVTGAGVRVAIFDTGLSKTHPHFKRVRERTNWTNEKTLDDGLGHGTFVAGVVASSAECLGFAPDAEVHVFRVFTNNQGRQVSSFITKPRY